jgi:hypothetical protein
MSTITQPISGFRRELIRWPINVHVAVDCTFWEAGVILV